MTVTVISCIYGTRFDRFVPEWLDAIRALERPADEIIISTDRPWLIPDATVISCRSLWDHPQAGYLQQAAWKATSDWIWIVDIDDLALPTGLNGIDQVDADVWQLGYDRTDGHQHRPPTLTNTEYRALEGNPYAAGSAIRTEAFRAVKGFPDIAFQDWGLWRRLAKLDHTFQASDRAHYLYRRHPETRSETELMPGRRQHHITEMLAND